MQSVRAHTREPQHIARPQSRRTEAGLRDMVRETVLDILRSGVETTTLRCETLVVASPDGSWEVPNFPRNIDLRACTLQLCFRDKDKHI